MKQQLISGVGWYGVAAILGAYMLLSFGIIEAKGYAYQLLNLTGALGIIVVAWSKRDTQPVVLNVIWAVVAVVALIGLMIG